MCNPSTADADLDDPTIRRCIGYAKAWGYDALLVTNLMAWRATDPGDLPGGAEAVGPGNMDALLTGVQSAGLVVCAWGAHPKAVARGVPFADLMRGRGYKLHALKLTKEGHPAHPLYLRSDLKPVTM